MISCSQRGVALIKKYESLQLQAYKCPAGIWTIGWGHTGHVIPGMMIDVQYAEFLLLQDIKSYERLLHSHDLRLNQNQFDALCSFVFNLGAGNFNSSTLLKKIKVAPCDPNIKHEFSRWIYSGGKILPGLVKRRDEEANLYFHFN